MTMCFFDPLSPNFDSNADSASGVERSARMLPEDAEHCFFLVPIVPTQSLQEKPDSDLETLKHVVLEESKPVGEYDELPSYLRIGCSTVEIQDPDPELVRQSYLDSIDKNGWALVRTSSWLGCEFAVKVFESGYEPEWDKGQLSKELRSLLELCHPHIVPLFCFWQDLEKHSAFAMEMVDADLQNVMNEILEPPAEPKPLLFSWNETRDMMIQIAEGMKYMSQRSIAYRDLKCPNILINEPRVSNFHAVKLVDFGLSRIKLHGVRDEAAFCIAGSTGVRRWSAPEAIEHFRGVKPSPDSLPKSDAFCFGLKAHEILIGELPFHGIKDVGLLKNRIQAGVRLELPRDFEELKRLIEKCQDAEPFEKERSYFQKICQALNNTLSKLFSNRSSGKVERQGKAQASDSPAYESSEVGVMSDAAMQRSGGVNLVPEYLQKGASGGVCEVGLVGISCAGKSLFIHGKRGSDEILQLGNSLSPGLIHSDEANEHRQTDYNELKVKANTGLVESLFGVKSCILSDDAPPTKRIRIRNWSHDEIPAVLELTDEAPSVDVGLDWEYDEVTDSDTDSETEEIDMQSEDEGLSGESDATFESQAEVTADSHVPRIEQSHEDSYETNSRYAGRKRSAATVDEDDLIARISSFVNKQIEDALQPLMSALESREQDEQKHRDKMLAVAEEELAVKRKELQVFRLLVNSMGNVGSHGAQAGVASKVGTSLAHRQHTN